MYLELLYKLVFFSTIFITYCHLLGKRLSRHYIARYFESCSHQIHYLLGLMMSLFWLAFAGLLILQFSSSMKMPIAIIILLVPLFATCAPGLSRKLEPVDGKEMGKAQRELFVVWILSTFVAIFMIALPISKPQNGLPDGPYVFKDWKLPVKIQVLAADYPPDNAIPAVVTEFLVRGISITDNRPLMPGQEISNRTILMSLVATPFRVLGNPDYSRKEISQFSYVGRTWPNTLGVVDDQSFIAFLASALPLNALLGVFIVALLPINRQRFLESRLRRLAIFFLTVCLNPFLLFQTVFTWPKNIAASCVLLAIFLANRELQNDETSNRRLRIVSVNILFAMSFLFHPMTLPFIAIGTLWLIWNYRNTFSGFAHVLIGTCVLILTLSPWFIWTRIVLKIPSDLLIQNQGAFVSWPQTIWIRLYNLFGVFVQPGLVQTSPPTVNQFIWLVFSSALSCSIILLLLGVIFWKKSESDVAIRNSIRMSLLGSIGCTFAFGVPTPTAIHGWQVYFGLVLIRGLSRLDELEPKNGVTVLMLTSTINMIIIIIWILSRIVI